MGSYEFSWDSDIPATKTDFDEFVKRYEQKNFVYADSNARVSDATVRILESVPSSDALGDWLRRMGAGAGLAGLACVQRRLLERVLTDSDCIAHTLDIDTTQAVAEK